MNFNGKFWHKPGHLGMTTAEVKKALQALPTPEAGDAGKAVLVNADADGYELGTAGGGEIFYPVYIIDDGEGNYTSDKTINEILSAMDENKIPVVIYEACEHWYNGNVGVNELIFTNVKPAVITNAISYSITDIRITNGNEVAITYTDAEVAATIT